MGGSAAAGVDSATAATGRSRFGREAPAPVGQKQDYASSAWQVLRGSRGVEQRKAIS